MHRTQVLLEEWQYEMLRTRAEREGRSIGDLVREILSRAFTEPREERTQRGLSAIAGIVHEPGLSGRDHDDAIYGPKRTAK